MQVKPEADFCDRPGLRRGGGGGGDQQPATSEERGNGRQPSYWGDSHLPDRGWNDCFGKIIAPPPAGTLGILSAHHLPNSLIGWVLKAGKEQVERQGVSLPEGHSTHDNPARAFIPFILFTLSTRLRASRGKHIGPLAFKINLILDLSRQTPDRPRGAAGWWSPEGFSPLGLPLQTGEKELVIKARHKSKHHQLTGRSTHAATAPPPPASPCSPAGWKSWVVARTMQCYGWGLPQWEAVK